MKLKLWMTQDEGSTTYEFWESVPILNKIGIWLPSDYGDFPILKMEMPNIPEHFRFEEGGAKAIRLVELNVTINGIKDGKR